MKQHTEQQVLNCIEESEANITTIAKRLRLKKNGGNGRCSWATAKKYIDTWKSTKEAYNNEGECVLDLAEKTVTDAIKNDKDVVTAKWYLMVKGQHRGFTKEIVIKTVDDFSDLPEDVLNWTVEDFAKATFLKSKSEGIDEENDVFEEEVEE